MDKGRMRIWQLFFLEVSPPIHHNKYVLKVPISIFGFGGTYVRRDNVRVCNMYGLTDQDPIDNGPGDDEAHHNPPIENPPSYLLSWKCSTLACSSSTDS